MKLRAAFRLLVPRDLLSRVLSLTTTLKSCGLSLVLHGTMIAALYTIPVSTTERFASQGRRSVVTFAPTHPTTVPINGSVSVVPPLTDSSEPLLERFVPPTAVDRATGLDHQPPSAVRLESPELKLPIAAPELNTGVTPILQRRLPKQQPDVQQVESPLPPIRPARPVAEFPVATASPIEQFVGLEERVPVDLSNNPPPVYPPEAVRRRLEGLVMLRIEIAKTGQVQKVVLVQSSGHPVLDRAAIEAVSRWQGKPAQRWGRAIESVERLPIRFRL